MTDKARRVRRALKTRKKIKELEVISLCIHRTPQHIYAQLIDVAGKIVAAVSTLRVDVKEELSGYTGNIQAAEVVGRKIAECAKALSIKSVAFDRSGFKYHGRIKALADAARNGGLEF